MVNSKVLGAVFGLIIGIVFVWQGPLEAFIVALFALAGWAVGKYLSGEIAIVDILFERFFSSRLRGPRG